MQRRACLFCRIYRVFSRCEFCFLVLVPDNTFLLGRNQSASLTPPCGPVTVSRGYWSESSVISVRIVRSQTPNSEARFVIVSCLRKVSTFMISCRRSVAVTLFSPPFCLVGRTLLTIPAGFLPELKINLPEIKKSGPADTVLNYQNSVC